MCLRVGVRADACSFSGEHRVVHHCVSTRMLFQGMLPALGAEEHRLKALRVNHQECFIALQLTASSQHCGSSLMCSAQSQRA